MIQPKNIDERVVAALLGQLLSRMAALRNDREPFFTHWALLAEMFLPRRYKWLITANNNTRRNLLNGSILDETGILAARTMSSGMMSGMTSPTKAWFDLGLKDLAEVPYGPAKIWLDDCRKRMLKVLAQSNFYTSIHTLYHDNGVFGSAAMTIYEDLEQVIRCHNPSLGEFFFATSNRQIVDSLYREFVFTVDQCVQEFGLENCSPNVQGQYRAGGAQRQQEIIINHAVEPNSQVWLDATTPLAWAIPKRFEYRECYWEAAGTQSSMLRCAGFEEKPFVGARWDVVSNEAYGRSPGMDAYAATKQIQVQQRRKAEAIDKMVRPPMNASVNMKNEPVSILPGAVNYVTDLANSGFAPAYKVEPRVQELGMDIDQTKERINSVFFVDLFLMIASLDTVRTATEIDARREEKLIQLGPVIERFENEVLDPIIERVFSIMMRRGLFAEPPPELQDMEIDVQYVSMLAEAQKAARSAGTERFLSLLGNLAGVQPSVMDIADTDALLEDYADGLNVTPAGIRSTEQIEALRAERAQQEQQAQMAEQAQQLAAGAKTLSETQVGGGQNALALSLGGL